MIEHLAHVDRHLVPDDLLGHPAADGVDSDEFAVVVVDIRIFGERGDRMIVSPVLIASMCSATIPVRSISFIICLPLRGRRLGAAGDPTVRADTVGESRLVRGVSLPLGESAH